MTKSITILDTETNGFKGSSVLSVCAFSVDTWLENQTRQFAWQEQFERYYYPEEQFPMMGAWEIMGK